MRYGLAYIVAALVFVAMDFCWLTLMGQRLYQEEIGQLLIKGVRWAPALAFYGIYLAGVVFFAVRPAVAAGRLDVAALNGAVLGLVAYGTYDLTNQATMIVWATRVTLADMGWGMAVTAMSATAASGVVIKLRGRA